jgi:DNA invertase Pin-like site-specific DNA recombinase
MVIQAMQGMQEVNAGIRQGRMRKVNGNGSLCTEYLIPSVSTGKGNKDEGSRSRRCRCLPDAAADAVHHLRHMNRNGRPQKWGFLLFKSLAHKWTSDNGVETKMIVGYARVSTDGQTLDAQKSALKANGAERIFSEKISGAVTDRKQLTKAIAALQSGDVLLVTRLDRLARSTRDLLNVLDAVGKAGAGFRSLADPMIDTTSPHGKLILAVLGALAEFERSMILARTSEGRRRAQGRGVRFGRKPKTRFQIEEALARRSAGEALTEIGRTYGVSHSTISRL